MSLYLAAVRALQAAGNAIGNAGQPTVDTGPGTWIYAVTNSGMLIQRSYEPGKTDAERSTDRVLATDRVMEFLSKRGRVPKAAQLATRQELLVAASRSAEEFVRVRDAYMKPFNPNPT